MTTFDREQ